MKAMFIILALSCSSHLFAKDLDVKKTINKYVDLSMGIGYNDGSTLSLQLQESRGPYNLETFKLYKEANEELTAQRPALQKELDSMGYFFERNIYDSKCKKILGELKTSSRGLGMIKGMHGIASSNEEALSQQSASASLENLNSDLKYNAINICRESFESISKNAEVL